MGCNVKVGDLVSDILTGLRGIIVETLGPEDMWLVLCENGEMYDCGDWELESWDISDLISMEEAYASR